METTGIIVVFIGIIGFILGFYWDNGKENGNYRNHSGFYRDYRVYIGSYSDNGK